jgi:hypothetical protein
MAVKVLFEGARFTVCAWLNEEERCQVEEFILELYSRNNPDSQAMVDLLDRTAKNGPPSNIEKFRHLKSIGQGLIEFKARGGSRILGFIDLDRKRIVCTHAIPKLKEKQFNREMKKAQATKSLYLAELNILDGGNYVN